MLYWAFLLGFMGSFHCIGMCSPIVLILPTNTKHTVINLLQIGFYFLGKTITYALLGLIFGLLGKGLFISNFQQEFSILIGVVMIFIGLLSILKIRTNFFVFELNKIKYLLGKQLKRKNFFSTFIIGILNGFLPCGLVYTALFSALINTQVIDTVLYMIFFGLGTIPLMLGIHFLKNIITLKLRITIQKTIPFFIIIMGIFLVIRGLGIGIPFISPSESSLIIQKSPDCIVPIKHSIKL